MAISTIEFIDRFSSLLHLESTAYHFTHYLALDAPPDKTEGCAALRRDLRDWRVSMCGWMYHVVDTHDLERELVAVALAYMDRYLSTCAPAITRRDLHRLVGMASLYIAVKVYGHQGRSLELASLARLSRGLFTEKHILTVEKSMLGVLQWRMHPPTPLSYLVLLVQLLPRGACAPFSRDVLFTRICFLLESSLAVPHFFGERPSDVAVAACFEVMEYPRGPNVPRWSCRAHFRHCVGAVAGIRCDSAAVLRCREGMKAVYAHALRQISDGQTREEHNIPSPVASRERALRSITP